jgi:TELO2-interacting protein 1
MLRSSLLTHETIPIVSRHLDDLYKRLTSIKNLRSSLEEGMIKYIFFPISEIIRKNKSSEIADHIMERLLKTIAVLLQAWWWTIDKPMWEKLIVFCNMALPSADKVNRGKEKQRDEETQLAAAQCLWELMRDHSKDPGISPEDKIVAASQIMALRDANILILAQVLSSMLMAATSPNQELQLLILRTLYEAISNYIGEKYMPTVLPGIISTMSRIVIKRDKGVVQRGEIVKASLEVMKLTIILSVGDEACLQAGVIRVYDSLDEFIPDQHTNKPPSNPNNASTTPIITRSESWLRATTSQLHNALNTFLPSLVHHPAASALEGLVDFCANVAESTFRTMQDSQKILLVPLLISSLHPFPQISQSSTKAVLHLLTQATASTVLVTTLGKLAQEHLAILPHLIQAQREERISMSLKVLTAVASLPLSSIRKIISRILGSNGGIEKWGLGILQVLELRIPQVFFSTTNTDVLLIQGTNEDIPTFPSPTFRYLTSSETQQAMVDFLRAWGTAAGDDALFSIAWLLGYASKNSGPTEVSALWCAARLLEGIAGSFLKLGQLQNPASHEQRHTSRLRRQMRWLIKIMSSLWERELEEESPQESTASSSSQTNNETLLIEFVKGLQPLPDLEQMTKHAKPVHDEQRAISQQMLYRSIALQNIAIASSILKSNFVVLLMQSLYSVLHSLISTNPFLNATAQATLVHISQACGYASPANLLLSNFDYALGSVSRYLSRLHFDVQAPKVLVLLVRLVGKGVVDHGSDVIEECFDRLDDYHGYRIVVEGLVDVLLETVRAIDLEGNMSKEALNVQVLLEERRNKPYEEFSIFSSWFVDRRKRQQEPSIVREDFGSFPRRAWGEKEEEHDEQEHSEAKKDQDEEPQLSSTQKLVQKIIQRSVYFLTHPSALIRARILSVLASSVSTLSSIESSILPTIHMAWPLILNRFSDPEPFVIVEAADLIHSLVTHVGHFMDAKVWNDVWPIFSRLIKDLERSDKHNALSRRTVADPIGTQSAYTTSHRLYASILRTITRAISDVILKDNVGWEVLLLCRRFLRSHVHEELQRLSRDLYIQFAVKNADAVWLALGGANKSGPSYLDLPDIQQNVTLVLAAIG